MKKILVIDDNSSILIVIQAVLTLRGFNVKTHLNCKHLFDVVNEFGPDLILLDISLPAKPGAEACKELKALVDIPILFFTTIPKQMIAYKDFFADGFMDSPFDIKYLQNAINFHLN